MELIKVRALVKETGSDDLGASGLTFSVVSLKMDKIYTQADTTNYDERAKRSPSFFVDDNGCSRDIAYMVANKLVEIIK